MSPVHPEIVRDVRNVIELVLEKIEHHDVPGPYDLTPDWDLGCVQVTWMLQEDQEASRAVVNAFPGTWKMGGLGSGREPIWEHESDDGLLKINLWAHRETIQMSVQIPQPS